MLYALTWMALAQGMEPSAEHTLAVGMGTLNGWAMANIATGSVLALTEEDPQRAAFHQMNAGWNTVNLALATASLLRDQPVEPSKLAKVFWINTAVDVGYVAGGLLLRQQGVQQGRPEWVGWGESIAVQGSFLFVFDGVMGWKMHRWSQPAPTAWHDPSLY